MVRSDYEKYPYVIKVNGSTDELDRDRNELLLNYTSPNSSKEFGDGQGENGLILHDVVLKTSYIDLSKDTIVIPMGERKLGYPVKGTDNYFQIKRHQLNGPMYPLDICIFRLPGVQGVQKSKFHRATPPGGGVGFSVALEKF